MNIQKVRTSPYRAQTNGQVEQAHQMLMHMIGKLSIDWKAEWPNYLPELVHTYNSPRSAITRYSPHYMMFRCQLHLPINFYFPMMRGMEKHQCVDCYIAKLCEWLWKAFRELQAQSNRSDYDRKANAFSLKTGDLVLAKADAYKGRGKWRTSGRKDCMKWDTRLLMASLCTSWKTSRWDAHESSTKTDFFSLLLERRLPFVWLCKLSGPCAPPPP